MRFGQRVLDMSPEDKFPLAYKPIRDSITVKGAHPGKSLERGLIANMVTTQHTSQLCDLNHGAATPRAVILTLLILTVIFPPR